MRMVDILPVTLKKLKDWCVLKNMGIYNLKTVL